MLNTLSYLKLTEPLWSKPCYLCLWGRKGAQRGCRSFLRSHSNWWVRGGWEPKHWRHSSFSCKHKPRMEISLIMLEFYFVFDRGGGGEPRWYTDFFYTNKPNNWLCPRKRFQLSAGKRPRSWWKIWGCQKELGMTGMLFDDSDQIFQNRISLPCLSVCTPPTPPHPKDQRTPKNVVWIQKYSHTVGSEIMRQVSKNYWVIKNCTMKTTGVMGKLAL